MSAGTFFSKPDYGSDREPSRKRPRAVNPRTGQEQSFTSASTFASALDNPYGLMKCDGRNIVMGISQRPDLAAMTLAGALRDDVSKVDEVIATAKEVMASSANANLGTAAHAAITRAWQYPNEPVPEAYVPLVKAFAAALKSEGLTIKAAAQKVMNLAYNSIGELDFVFEEADGTCVIGDAKSGNLDHAKRKFAVQVAMYAGAEYWLNPNGSTGAPLWPIAQTHGVIVHLDLEHNTASVYRIDLRIGRYGAGLAEQIRQWHTLDPLSPYVGPVGLTPKRVENRGTVEAAALGPKEPSLLSSPSATSAVETTTATTPVGTDDNPPELDLDQNLPGDPPPEPRFNELMRRDKAQLQQILKHTFQWTDDAHNRRWLARAIVALEQGLTGAAVKKYAAAKDDGPAQAPITQVAAVVQEHVGPSSATLLQAIAGANSMAAIRALQADVVERRGDQAWTDELVEAVRVRTRELAAQQHQEAVASTLAEIKAATTKEELKNIWERVTIGNSVPENWTDELTNAGLTRLDEITKATPPPPANPFA